MPDHNVALGTPPEGVFFPGGVLASRLLLVKGVLWLDAGVLALGLLLVKGVADPGISPSELLRRIKSNIAVRWTDPEAFEASGLVLCGFGFSPITRGVTQLVASQLSVRISRASVNLPFLAI